MRFFSFLSTLLIFSFVLGAADPVPAFEKKLDKINDFRYGKAGKCLYKQRVDQKLYPGQEVVAVDYTFENKDFAFLQVELSKENTVAEFDSLSFQIYNDGSRNFYRFICIDKEGEAFQSRITPGKAKSWTKCRVLCKDMRFKKDSSVKKGDKKITFPLKKMSFRVINSRIWITIGKNDLKGTFSVCDLKVFSKSTDAKRLLASATASSNKKVAVAQPQSGIVLDGKLNEWNKKSPIRLNKSSCKLIQSSAPLHSGILYFNYDDKNLYVGVEVEDENPYGKHEKGGIWQNDGLEIWFDFKNNSLSTMNQPDDYQIGLCYTTPSGKPGVWVWRNEKPAYLLAGTRLEVSRTRQGYIMEASIPLKGFRGLPEKVDSHIIGMNVSLGNSDPGKFSRLLWSGNKEGQPVQFGLMSFGEVSPEALASAWQQRKAHLSSTVKKGGIKKNYEGAPVFLKIDAPLKGKRYLKYEITADLSAEYKNPYDFDDFRLYAEFTAPSRKKYTVDGFYFEPFRLVIYSKLGDVLSPDGTPRWKVRFAPRETGRYSWRLFAVDKKGRKTVSKTKSFICNTSDSDGFLRVSPDDHAYLQFDSGKAFYGMGYAAHFWRDDHILTYLKGHLNQVAALGGNYLSINLENIQDCGFKMEKKKLGWYDQKNAAKLDHFFEIAEARNVYIIPCLNQSSLGKAKRWSSNQYNKKNGGPCIIADEYFYNPEALRLIKNRTRYTVARWGYSTSILAWEMFNEVNYTAGYLNQYEKVKEFFQKLSSWLKKYDHSKHLVTSSFGSGEMLESPEIWKMDGIDTTITHIYVRDLAEGIYKRQTSKLAYGKPTIGGEAGIPADDACCIEVKDKEGISFHNIVWGSAFAKCAGNVLVWWNTHLIEPFDHGRRLTPFSLFQKDIDWPREAFRRKMLPVMKKTALKGSMDMVISCKPLWTKKLSAFYELRPDGIWGLRAQDDAKIDVTYIADTDLNIKVSEVPGILFGQKEDKEVTDLVLKVKPSKNSSILLTFSAVAKEGASLSITCNGKTIENLSVTDSDGENNPYAKEFSKQVKVPLEKNRMNEIRISNKAAGWVVLDKVLVKDFLDANLEESLRCFALLGKRKNLLWIQSRFSTWYQNYLGVKPEISKNTEVSVPVKTDGRYKVEWWDTWTGKIINKETVNSQKGLLKVSPPPFIRDIAAKIYKPKN